MTDSASVAKSLDAKQDKLMPHQVILTKGGVNAGGQPVAPRTLDTPDVQFPTTRFESKDKKTDQRMEMKMALSDGQGNTPFGKMELKESDIDYILKKEATIKDANYQKWFAQNFDRMDPANKAAAVKLMPKFYKERQRVIKKQCKNLQKLASLKLYGARNKEDLYYQYLAETGQLDVGPLKQILEPKQSDAQGKLAFRRGLLNTNFLFGNRGPTELADGEKEAEAYLAPLKAQESSYKMGVGERLWPGEADINRNTGSLGVAHYVFPNLAPAPAE